MLQPIGSPKHVPRIPKSPLQLEQNPELLMEDLPEQTCNNNFGNMQVVPHNLIWEKGHLRLWSGGWPLRQTKALFSKALKFFVQVPLCYFLYSFTIKASWVLFRFSINSLSALVMCTQRPTTTYIYFILRFLHQMFRNTNICHTTKERKDIFSLKKRMLWESSEQHSPCQGLELVIFKVPSDPNHSMMLWFPYKIQ